MSQNHNELKELFGTDGVRGKVNTNNMNADFALKFGMAVGTYFINSISDFKNDIVKNNTKKSEIIRVIIAKDTRLSGYMIETAITSGLLSIGIDVILVGPMPTPSLPMLIHSLRADFGIMITASHNPYYDNGMKIFNSEGYKINSDEQKAIRNIMIEESTKQSNIQFENYLATPEYLGKARRLEDAMGRYIEYVKSVYDRKRKLSGLRIILDCANGAAYKIAPMVFWELGAEVITINCEPNGININEKCGSMYPEELGKKVVENNASIGIAFDGDADRLLVCDENGKVIPGDLIIGVITEYMHRTKTLKGDGIVVTHASNHGLIQYVENLGLKVWITKIGDQYVCEEMIKRDCNFGGEQSGHLIFREYTSTGDGIIAALQLINAIFYNQNDIKYNDVKQKINNVKINDIKISNVFNAFKLLPQITRNIKYNGQNPLDIKIINEKINDIIAKNLNMRFIVRKSGTENVIRVMIEGSDDKTIFAVANSIENVIKQSNI